MKLRRLSTRQRDFDAKLAALTRYQAAQDARVERVAKSIIADVRRRGDAAVLAYSRKFDGVRARSVGALEFSGGDLKKALRKIPKEDLRALRMAAHRIRRFHEKQRANSWTVREADGTVLGQRVSPLERVGIYVPGGKAAYPSSVLMNAIPAKVAGVGEIVMVSPNPVPLVLGAAAIAGVDRVIAIGGAQAVAALACGTKSVPRVDKIVGPGNAYVAAAKRQLFGEVGIDMIAGPSEILVICDGGTDPEWVAMDLFSQAEHDELAQAILLCPSLSYLARVEQAVARLMPEMQRREIIRASLAGRGALIHVRNLGEACRIANAIAPEHLELSVANPRALLPKLRHAGAIFLGRWSSEAIGDYCAGPNHILPTAGTARFSSPLGVYDFQKRSSVIGVSPAGARTLGRLAATLARGEGLQAHARSAEMRTGGRR
ncbi:MAG TPA: histidinol dehydrogenase [Burkholderiales bacterium]|jgi:histidinol dehydrogenase|nr:histidinol dehydrogenase [Burkholderiales bacterium]